MGSLRSSLESLAEGFAIDVVRAIQGASLLELRREVAGGSRRSSEDIGAVLQSVISLLRSHSGGLRAEQIRRTLQLQSREMPRVLSDGLRRGTLRKEGQKRATKYFAV